VGARRGCRGVRGSVAAVAVAVGCCVAVAVGCCVAVAVGCCVAVAVGCCWLLAAVAVGCCGCGPVPADD
jgi:hypothetical protein